MHLAVCCLLLPHSYTRNTTKAIDIASLQRIVDTDEVKLFRPLFQQAIIPFRPEALTLLPTPSNQNKIYSYLQQQLSRLHCLHTLTLTVSTKQDLVTLKENTDSLTTVVLDYRGDVEDESKYDALLDCNSLRSDALQKCLRI